MTTEILAAIGATIWLTIYFVMRAIARKRIQRRREQAQLDRAIAHFRRNQNGRKS